MTKLPFGTKQRRFIAHSDQEAARSCRQRPQTRVYLVVHCLGMNECNVEGCPPRPGCWRALELARGEYIETIGSGAVGVECIGTTRVEPAKGSALPFSMLESPECPPPADVAQKSPSLQNAPPPCGRGSK